MSIVGVMITNGGTHSPEKWAAMTAGQIIQIGEQATGTAVAHARKMELKVLDILEDAHREVQEREKEALAQVGPQYLLQDIDPSRYVEKPVIKIIEASAGSPYERHFALEEVKIYLRNLLRQHFGTAMHVERSTFADQIPDNPLAKIYKSRYGGSAVQAPAQQ